MVLLCSNPSQTSLFTLAPMLRIAISFSSSDLYSETLQKNLPVARAKQLDRSMKEPLGVRRRQDYPARPPR